LADEVGEALQKVAGTSDSLGVSLEKVSSWIAIVSSRTREGASVIGNSIKSIMSRYTSIKETGFNEEDATNINEVTKALKEAGIKAVDETGNLRNFADVVDDLGTRWDKLNPKLQNYIATTLAGTFQMNRFRTLMNDYSQSLEYYEGALNSAGITNQKFAIYQESAASKLDRLKATWEEFWQNSLNSDTIKTAIDLLTSLISAFDNLGKILGVVGGLFLIYKSGVIGFTTSLIGLTTVAGGATVALTTMQRALGLIGLVLTGVTLGISLFTDKTYALNEATVEHIQKTNEQVKSTDSLVKQYESLKTKYDEVVESGGDVKEVKTQIFNIVEQLNKIYPDLISKIDDETVAYDRQIGVIKNLSAAKKQSLLDEAQVFLDANKTAISEAENKVKIANNVKELYNSKQLTPVRGGNVPFTDAQEYFKNSLGLFGVVGSTEEEIAQGVQKVINESKDAQKLIEQATANQNLIKSIVDSNENGTYGKAINDPTSSYYNAYKNRNKSISGTEGSMGGGGTKSSSSSPYRSEVEVPESVIKKERYSFLNIQEQSINAQLEENEAILQNANDKDKIILLDARNKLLKQRQQIIGDSGQKNNNLARELRSERSELVNQLLGYGAEFIGQGDQMSATNMEQVLGRQTDIVNSLRASKDKKLYTEQKQLLEDMTQTFNRFFDIQGKELPKIKVQWNTLNGEINKNKKEIQDIEDNVFKINIDSYTDGIKKYNVTLDDLEYKYKLIEDTNIEERIKVIGEQIKVTTDKSNEYKKILDSLNFITPQSEKQAEDLTKTQEDLNKKYRDSNIEIAELTNKQQDLNRQKEETIKKNQQEAVDSYLDYVKDQIDKQIEKIEQEKDVFTETKRSEIELLEKQIDKLKEQNDLIDEQIDRQKYLDNIAKAKTKVSNIEREKNVRIFSGGSFQWMSDPQKLQEATEELKDIETDYQKWERDTTLKHQEQQLRGQIDLLENQIKDKEKWAKIEEDNLRLHLTTIDDLTKTSTEMQITSWSQLMEVLISLGGTADEQLTRVQNAVSKMNSLGFGVKASTSGNSLNDYAKSQGYKDNAPGQGNAYFNMALARATKHDTGGELSSGKIAVNLSGKPERILSPEQTQTWDHFVNILQPAVNIFDRILTNIKTPNFTPVISSPTSASGSTEIYNFNKDIIIQANDVSSFIRQMRGRIRS
jgi:hypothetical protein